MQTDLISRSAVLDCARKVVSYNSAHLDINAIYVVDVEDIEYAPTIDAVPVVHARWIYSGYVDADGNRHANCSRCGAGEEHKEEWTDKVPYCWKCGARMDAKEDTDGSKDD